MPSFFMNKEAFVVMLLICIVVSVFLILLHFSSISEVHPQTDQGEFENADRFLGYYLKYGESWVDSIKHLKFQIDGEFYTFVDLNITDENIESEAIIKNGEVVPGEIMIHEQIGFLVNDCYVYYSYMNKYDNKEEWDITIREGCNHFGVYLLPLKDRY